jgi:hypothetical protein
LNLHSLNNNILIFDQRLVEHTLSGLGSHSSDLALLFLALGQLILLVEPLVRVHIKSLAQLTS